MLQGTTHQLASTSDCDEAMVLPINTVRIIHCWKNLLNKLA
jgi:hypothetical protein